jgi:protein SCO1/2
MRSLLRRLGSGFLIALGLLACQPSGPEVLDDLSDASYSLTAHDSSAVAFPADYSGDILVVGYVYTMCPDICPMTTANMKRVYDRLQSREDVRFVTVTFDPKRDTPRRLREYRTAYKLEETPWDFLTGDTTAINRLMKRVDVRHRVVTASGEPASPDTLDAYFVDHTDQVNLIDAEGRIRGEYSGSRTPPEFIVEDINKLR